MIGGVVVRTDLLLNADDTAKLNLLLCDQDDHRPVVSDSVY